MPTLRPLPSPVSSMLTSEHVSVRSGTLLCDAEPVDFELTQEGTDYEIIDLDAIEDLLDRLLRSRGRRVNRAHLYGLRVPPPPPVTLRRSA